MRSSLRSLAILAACLAAAATAAHAQTPQPTPAARPLPGGPQPSASVFDSQPAPPLTGASPGVSAMDQLESALGSPAANPAVIAEDEGASTKKPDEVDIFDFRNMPLEKAFRILGRRARLNLIIPPIKDERISLRLEDLTPKQAFLELARIRGFKVAESGLTTTVTRSDIAAPATYSSETFTLREVSADLALQPIANLLGVSLTAPQLNAPVLPKPLDAVPPAANISETQGRPRFTPAVPIDEPAARAGGSAPVGSGGGAGAAAPQNVGGERGTAVFVIRRTNQIVVTAIPEDLDRVRLFLRQFDRYVPQVRLTAYIMEINESNDDRTGFDWSNSLGQTGLQLGITQTGTNGYIPPVYKLTKGFFLQGAILDAGNLTTVLRALISNSRVRLVATPTVITTPGIPAQLQAISKETVAVTTNDLSAGVSRQNVELRTFVTGLTLDATVRVLPNGSLPININPQLSTKTGVNQTPIGNIPIISQRGVTNDVTIPDGSAVVLGGVVNMQDEAVRNGIPFLRDVPLVKYLFSSRGRTTSRSNLVIIVSAKTLDRNGSPLFRYGTAERQLVQDAVGDLPGEPTIPTLPTTTTTTTTTRRVVRPAEDPKRVRTPSR